MGGGSGAAAEDGRRGCGRGGSGGGGGRTAGAVVAANGGRRAGRVGRCRRVGGILQQQLLDLEDVDVLVEAGTGVGTVVYSRSVVVVASVGGDGRGSSAQATKAV